MQIPIWLYWPSSHGRHWVCDSSGCVPGRHAAHEMPSVLISFSPQTSQKVEEDSKEHLVPTSHGFSAHAARADATVQTAVPTIGSSIVVFVMRRDEAAVTDKDAPFGAVFVRKMLSRMEIGIVPDVVTAPPWPELI